MTTKQYSFERYLNVRSAYGPGFSPDESVLSFLTNITGVAEVWSVSLEDKHIPRPLWPEQLTFRGERVASAAFSPQANELLVAADSGGNELMQLYLLAADGSQLIDLTARPNTMYLFGGWSPDGKRITYSSNERDPRYFDIYERDMASGEVRAMLVQDGSNYAYGYAPDGSKILVSRQNSNVRNQLILIDTISGEERVLVPEISEGAAAHLLPAWSIDRRGLYLLSNRDRQFLSLAYLDLETSQMTYLTDLSWDIELLALTKDGTRMAMVINEDGCSRLELFDVSRGWQERQELRGPVLPRGVVNEVVWSPYGSKLAITLTAADDAMDVWVWDFDHGVIRRTTQSSLGGIPRKALVSPSLIRYPTFDGREIPAFLYLPQSKQRNLGVVINVHGGPEGQTRPIFDPVTQYLVSCGYGVLAPNVRGSTGYGYEYQSLDDVELRMDSVADLRHAALWLTEKGIADPHRLAVMGGSYGGFMVLSAITTYPELWAAAVDIVGIANFVTFLENTGPWRRKLREAEYGSLEQNRAFLEKISPIHAIDRVVAPLFVVHGANDPRVPIGETEQIVSALHQRNVPVEYLRFEDEGHGLIKRANRLVAYPAIANFLAKYLGE
ncbi:S9 family peptidase [Ktedonosporobacter rubrisoli]|uniref:Acyl-peptide hydrolase n=1 Tax=Ktedonosporobacter rubrisoli TaxID=2509675 RepID=A0A4P6K2W0_KTERU|nr:S9 family peptidase [Ktedonosporobacter rubrisoli]QBD82213.1 S9 family peptidase [Ktedonosporobacter rubrisoli]